MMIYLKGQVNNINVFILIDTRTMNPFMTRTCAKWLKMEVEDIILLVKINFAQRSSQAVEVVRSVWFKASTTKFEEDFTIYKLDYINVMLGNTFLHHGVEVRQRPSVHIVMVGLDDTENADHLLHLSD